MPVRSVRVVRQALQDKGMIPDEGDHEFFRKNIPGVNHLVTKISHSGKDIGDAKATRMANQLCLHLREFWSLVDCPLSEEDWEAIVRQRCPNGTNPLTRRGY
jgi:hypothetical protein